jgi:hypothetical protein
MLSQALHTHGDLAQLGERFAGSEEVRGSIPLVSTKHLVLVMAYDSAGKENRLSSGIWWVRFPYRSPRERRR